MGYNTFAQQLEEAALRIDDLTKAELQTLLVQAAAQLKSGPVLGFDPDIEAAVETLATQTGETRMVVLHNIVRDWMSASARLRPEDLDYGDT